MNSVMPDTGMPVLRATIEWASSCAIREANSPKAPMTASTQGKYAGTSTPRRGGK